MIILKLDTKNICEECPIFVPDMAVRKGFTDNEIGYTEIVVNCKHRSICDYLEQRFAKKYSPIIEEDDSLKGKVTSI